MKKTTVNGSCGVFLNPKYTLVAVLFGVIICVPACVVGLVCVDAGGHIIFPAVASADSKLIAEQSGEWQTVRMRVTAYCPCPKCCGEYSDGQTACGHKISPGDTFVAADKKYRFGTEMLIAGYNSGEPVKVLDRGGAISGDRLDVFFNSHEEALEWGVKYVNVKVRLMPKM
jgi:3D (Asp-Asp-Asp) domain-containing protein